MHVVNECFMICSCDMWVASARWSLLQRCTVKPVVLDYPGCVTGPRFVIVCSTRRSTRGAIQTKQELCSALCVGMDEREELTCPRVCVSLCVVQWLMVGSGNAPSLTPLHGIRWDFLVPELSSEGLIDVCVWAQGIIWYMELAIGESSSSDCCCRGLSKTNKQWCACMEGGLMGNVLCS